MSHGSSRFSSLEHYSCVRRDIYTISQDVDKLTAQVDNVCPNNARRSGKWQEAMNFSFESWFTKTVWDLDVIALKGVEVGKSEFVPWDGIYGGIHRAEEKTLFLLQTRESASCEKRESLYLKGKKTS